MATLTFWRPDLNLYPCLIGIFSVNLQGSQQDIALVSDFVDSADVIIHTENVYILHALQK